MKAGGRDVAWTIGTTIFGAVCQLVQVAVAARYLNVHDFGVLAIVNVMIAIVSGIQDMGLSSYCIHAGELSRRSQSTLFWISTALGCAGAVVVIGAAVPISMMYEMPTLTQILVLLSVNFVLVGLVSQYQANFIRIFKAKLLAQVELAARLVAFVGTLILLWNGSGVAAIVLGVEIFALVKLIMLAACAPPHWHPRLEFDRTIAKPALAYGSFQAGSYIIAQFRMQADQLILGKALGPEALGLYSIAKDLIAYPMRVMQPLISRLILPTLARHQHDQAALRAVYLRALSRTAWYCCGIYALLALAAPWVVEILYGTKFMSAAALIPLMCVFAALRPMAQTTGLLAQAVGRTQHEFGWNAWVFAITFTVNLAVAYFSPDIKSFAVALSLTQILVTLLAYPMFVKPLERIGMRNYLKTWTLAGLAAVLASLIGASGWLHLPAVSSLTHSLKSLAGFN